MTALHLVVDVSAHGFGHLAQVAPVVAVARRRIPHLRVTVRSGVEPAQIRRRMGPDVAIIRESVDVNLAMASAVDVRVAESHRAYVEFHRDWEARLSAATQALGKLAPDLVLADVPYLSLAAAARAGIPAVALCSLNWADIYHAYCGHLPEGPSVHQQVLGAYREARLFLQPAPHMPMTTLTGLYPIDPIVQTGTSRRATLRARIGAPAEGPVALVALGGLDLRLPVETWSRELPIHWLVPRRWGIATTHVTPLEDCGLPFPDLLASVDLLVAKPGYGTFAEAAALGLPVLYLDRPDWPETPYLCAWLADYVPCAGMTRDHLEGPRFAEAIHRLLTVERPAPVTFRGEEQAAEQLLRLLGIP